MELDSVRIGTDDLPAARQAYETLLGVTPHALAGGGCRFQLAPGAVELVAGPPGLHALTFVGPAAGAPPDFHGLDVRVVPAAERREPPAREPDAAAAIDHVVVRTTDPERAIALWRDRLGLRLAFDREFPERGLRLQFFRSGGMTLEYASPLPAVAGTAPADGVYGVSYRVADLAARRARLLAAGVDVSELRPGMKPGTAVCTVRAGTAGVPTLLLQPAPG